MEPCGHLHFLLDGGSLEYILSGFHNRLVLYYLNSLILAFKESCQLFVKFSLII